MITLCYFQPRKFLSAIGSLRVGWVSFQSLRGSGIWNGYAMVFLLSSPAFPSLPLLHDFPCGAPFPLSKSPGAFVRIVSERHEVRDFRASEAGIHISFVAEITTGVNNGWLLPIS